jgi:hypothetical protein
MLQDVGATFGPVKANLAQWEATPVWSDRATCTVSMRALPYQGSTFPDARISDTARVQVGRDLASFTDAELRVWFASARLPEFYTATADERDLAVWTRAFRRRVEQILDVVLVPSESRQLLTPQSQLPGRAARPDGRISTPDFQFPTPTGPFGERLLLGVGSWALGVGVFSRRTAWDL